jgi:dihydroflavonol-4-reductase
MNPGLVLGVPLDAQYGGSLEVVERLFTGADPMLPDLDIPIADVADVAKMHRLVLEADAASGERFPAVARRSTHDARDGQDPERAVSASKAKLRNS